MVEITLADKEKIPEACALLGMEYRDSMRLFTASESNEQAGICLVDFFGEKGTAVMKTNGKGYIYDGVLRSALNLMLENGVKEAAVTGEENKILLSRLGFHKQGGQRVGEVNDRIFDCCEHK